MGEAKTKLDASARFYPIMAGRHYQSLYRFTVQLECRVDAHRLERAVRIALDVYDVYKVRLKRGYAWHQLVHNDKPFILQPYDGKLLSVIDFKKNNDYLFRITCEGDIIRLDMFHALTDGTGAMAFLTCILEKYAEIGCVADNKSSNNGHSYLSADCSAENSKSADKKLPDAEWGEDAFERYYKPVSLGDIDLKGMAGSTPHRIEGTLTKDGLKSFGLVSSAGELLSRAKALGASYTAYLVGAVAYAIERSTPVRKPLVLMVPINLRGHFPSETKRNFTLFARVIIEPGKCKALADYVNEAKLQLARGIQNDVLERQISTTVKGMNNVLVRCCPLFLKATFARLGKLFMRSRQTVIISNLGRVSLDGLKVKDISLNLNVSKNNVQNLAVLSFNDKARLTFTSAIEQLDFPKELCAVLREEGVHIENNTL